MVSRISHFHDQYILDAVAQTRFHLLNNLVIRQLPFQTDYLQITNYPSYSRIVGKISYAEKDLSLFQDERYSGSHPCSIIDIEISHRHSPVQLSVYHNWSKMTR